MNKKRAYQSKPMFRFDFASLYPSVVRPVMDEEWVARMRSIARNHMIDEILADLEKPENIIYVNG